MNTRHLSFVLGCVSVILISTLPATTQAAPAPVQAGGSNSVHCTDGTMVKTKDGPVCGVTSEGVTSYFGIPYAAPPVGDLRFAPPQPAERWTTMLQAVAPPPVCTGPQGNDKVAYKPVGSEDCLKLKVQLPAGTLPNAHLPVMVQIHGGGFIMPLPPEDGAYLAKHGDIVYVAMNYRLGILGFLAHKSFGHDSGDWGILDQQSALHWVQNNIAKFGGDPGNVTILGDSAGGASSCIQIVSPTAKGLFQKANPQSGFYNAVTGSQQVWAPSDCKSQYITQHEAEQAGIRFASKVGCGNVQNTAACLRQKDWKTLVMAAGKVNNPTANGTSGTIGPTLNAKVIPMSPGLALATGHINNVKIINGAARDEFNGFGDMSSPAAHSPEEYRQQVRKQYGDLAPEIMKVYPLARFSSPFIALRTVIADSDTMCPMLALDRKLAQHATLYAYVADNSDMPNVWGDLRALDPNEPNGSYHILLNTALYQSEKIAAASPNQAAFVKEVIAQLSGFARTGSPMVSGTPEWVPFEGDDPRVMMLRPAGTSHMLPISVIEKTHHCAFWNEHQSTPHS